MTFHYVGPLCSGYHGNYTQQGGNYKVANQPVSLPTIQYDAIQYLPCNMLRFIVLQPPKLSTQNTSTELYLFQVVGPVALKQVFELVRLLKSSTQLIYRNPLYTLRNQSHQNNNFTQYCTMHTVSTNQYRTLLYIPSCRHLNLYDSCNQVRSSFTPNCPYTTQPIKLAE